MALFRQCRGSRASLDAQPLHDGYAYFCTDDGTFHIDYADADGNLHRKQINAKEAEELVGYDITTTLNSSDVEIPTSKTIKTYVDNAVANAGSSIELDTTLTQSGKAADAKVVGDALAGKANTSDIPAKVSDLTNDSGFITGYTETDPTVPDWAKASTKPSYTKSEVGLGNVDNVKQYSASNPPPYPVTSVNGNTGAVTVSVPTKVSELTNDSGYLTSVPSEYVTETELNAKGYLTQHQSLSGYAKTADHYTKTESDNKYQAKGNYLTSVPSEYITETELSAKGYLTSAPVTKVNNKTGAVTLSASDVGADASGTASSAVSAHNTNTSAHADIREQISQLSSEIVDIPNNDLLLEKVADKVPYVKVAEPPTFVDSVDEMTDISKMYVLKSDGMFYSYKAHTTTTPGGTVANFTNKVSTSIDESGAIYNGTGYKNNTRLSSSGAEKEDNYNTAFGYIPAKGGDTIRFKSVSKNGTDVIWYDTAQSVNYICAYDANFTLLYAGNSAGGYNTSSLVDSMSLDGSVNVITLKNVANIAYIRISVKNTYSLNDIIGESAIITVNEEITYTTTEEGTTTTYSWEPTGILYNQPADYEHRVIAMENELEVLLNGTF